MVCCQYGQLKAPSFTKAIYMPKKYKFNLYAFQKKIHCSSESRDSNDNIDSSTHIISINSSDCNERYDSSDN